MTYHTPTAPATARLEIKKSEFIAYAYPIDSRDALSAYLENLKAKYPDARHICYGYIIGDPNNTTSAGFSDDGEPNGTAGRPILNVLQHKAIGNVAVFVVRYFGGIKLGAGGLTRAYSDATNQVVNLLQLQPFIAKKQLLISTDFANEGQVRHFVQEFGGEILACKYDDQAILTVALIDESVGQLTNKIEWFAVVRQI